MAYKKENLERLLEFVKVLYNDPECKDFADGIRAMTGGNPAVSGIPKIDKIEQYLGLDYGLDTAVNPDYSFIKDAKARETLNADWREMLRFRYGLRGHSVDFGEFVRYANLQMEMLVNLYFANKYGNDPDAILLALQTNAQTSHTNGKNYPFYPSKLTLYAMVSGILYEFGWMYCDNIVLFNIIEVRNYESHRSPEALKKNIDDLKIELARLKSKSEHSEDEVKRIGEIPKQIKKLQNFSEWFSRSSFAEIEQALRKLTERIKSSIVY